MRMSFGRMQAWFEECLPDMERWGDRFLRWVRCRDERADMVAEAVGMTWASWLSIWRRGKRFPGSPLVVFQKRLRDAQRGRRLAASKSLNEPLSLPGRIQSHRQVRYLGDRQAEGLAELQNDLADKRNRDGIADLVACTLDWEAFYGSLPERMRIALDLRLSGATAGQIARAIGCSRTTWFAHLRNVLRDWLSSRDMEDTTLYVVRDDRPNGR